MSTGLILLAGGVGTRMGRPVPKQFILLGGRPIIMHVLERIENLADVDHVVITCPQAYLDQTREMLAHRGFSNRFTCVVGGDTRQASVQAALAVLKDVDRVVVHEAVRPFVTSAEFKTLLDDPEPNAFYGAPIPFTVVGGGEYLDAIYERETLVNVQLPQKFDAAVLRAAHERANADGRTFTEDASMVFAYNLAPVKILPGSSHNIKITNPSDLAIAEAIHSEFFLGRGHDA